MILDENYLNKRNEIKKKEYKQSIEDDISFFNYALLQINKNKEKQEKELDDR